MKMTVALFLPVFLALPAAAQINIPVESYVLKNGLTVILSEDHSVPIVSVNIWYHVGSGREEPGRTGFAHLFEHMLFQGSQHVGDDKHFAYVQEAGGTLNGSTNNDRTNYFETVPSQFLELVLWLESDRMGFLLPAMTQTKLDNQRDVVKNERRQRVDNQPYGQAFEKIHELLYETGYPYYWPVIGSMEDLSAASLEDIENFFRRYYTPNNASLVIVGDFDPAQTKTWVEEYFGTLPGGEPVPVLKVAPPSLQSGKGDFMEDRVQLPRLYLAWNSPALAASGDAEMDILANVLAGGKSSRLYRELVYEKQIAQDVSAFQYSRKLSGMFMVQVTAKPDISLDQIKTMVLDEINNLVANAPAEREIQRSKNGIRAGFLYGLQSTAGKADQINSYEFFWNDPGALGKDLARYESVTDDDLREAASTWFGGNHIVFSVVPLGKSDLAAH